MHKLVMHKWALAADMRLGDELEQNIVVSVKDDEAARLAAMRKVLGGQEDASKVAAEGRVMMFRRLDETAPGGVGYAVSGQVFDENGFAMVTVKEEPAQA